MDDNKTRGRESEREVTFESNGKTAWAQLNSGVYENVNFLLTLLSCHTDAGLRRRD